MPLVPPDSPLRKISTDVDRRAVLYLDGIRYSFHIFDLAASRLERTLQGISRDQNDQAQIAEHIALAISDAWILVDSAHRLRELVSQVPRLRKKEPAVQLLQRRTVIVEKLRNHFQHFRTGIDEYVSKSMPLWGTLNWISPDPDSGGLKNYTIAPGTFFPGAVIPMGVFDRIEGKFTHRLSLQVGPARLDLADLTEHITEFCHWYTGWFSGTFPNTENSGADVFFCLTTRPVQSDRD